MGAVLAGGAADPRFILCRNDLWRLKHRYGESFPLPFGHLALAIDGMRDASYQVSQDLYTATTAGVFTRDRRSIELRAYVAATCDLLVIELAAVGVPIYVSAALQVYAGRGGRGESGVAGDVFWGERSFADGVDIASGAAVAWKALGAEFVAPDGSFKVTPGQPVTIVLAMGSTFRAAEYTRETIRTLDALRGVPDMTETRRAHEAWWAGYWAKSYVRLDDPVIERQYYLSLYGLGSCSRDPAFPPPIFGWTTTDQPAWFGDYHLNYNHQAPFYGLARANRLEQADPHDAPLLDFLKRAEWHCRAVCGHEGGLYPVGIGPKGIETTYGAPSEHAEHGGYFLGQRTNGAYGLVNVAARWYATYDPDYGRKVYPLVLQQAVFWQNYLVWDDAGRRYVVEGDAIQEGSGADVNGCLALGLVRNALRLALDLSTALGVDADRREKWMHILGHLSSFPVQERDGRCVFRYTERGTVWRDSNTLGIQHVYPAGQIGLDSEAPLLDTARNTIDVMQRWHDGNGSNSFFPAAVRVGYPAERILEELRRYCEHMWPNGFRAGNAHGIENFSTVHNTVNEMLCMDHGGVLRVFRVWPPDRDASFHAIRCHGAFLVCGSLAGGKVRWVRIHSEKGGDCALENPWVGEVVQVVRNGVRAETVSGAGFTLAAIAGEALELRSAALESQGGVP